MTTPTTWADAVDVKALTGATVSDSLIDQATGVIELTSGGRLARLDPAHVTGRDFDWLRRAVCYQAAWMASQPDYFERLDVADLDQDGVVATFKADGLVLAPLARRCLKRLSWRGVRTIRPGASTTLLPGAAIGYGAGLPDDDLPWRPM
jgi:hypothetical protein